MNKATELIINFTEIILLLIVVSLFMLYIYDKYVQRKHQLLINYPVIGRMRYLFEALREPLRQYFAEETFYESRDKIDWVYNASKNLTNYMSFSVSQPFGGSRFIVKHANHVLNSNEVSEDISVVFGENRPKPFHAKSPLIRSAMSDGALSPEAVRAFSLGAKNSGFPLNTGEGGLTSNYFYTHKIPDENSDYLTIIHGDAFKNFMFHLTAFFFNKAQAINMYRSMLIRKDTRNTYLYDSHKHSFFRVNWDAPLQSFPKEVPEDMPDLILQIGSGLYGVRDSDGNFDAQRYQKVMRFCKMTEIKIAQGAKQTGGKLLASKVTPDIAYYRGVPQGKDLFSPNRFPFANDTNQLCDFVGELQTLSEKPVGFKIVISDAQRVEELVSEIAKRKKAGKSIPDYISVDSGEGGSATAPLEMMESVGLQTNNSLYILDTILRKHHIREDIKIIASGKILTPDDAIITMCMGADALAVARGYMMAAGCIRARQCAGQKYSCPIGLATQDPKRRRSYLVQKKGREVASYHEHMLKGIKGMLSIMGIDHISKLNKSQLSYKNNNGEVFFNIDKYFHQKLHV